MKNEQTSCINTVFFKRRNKITSIDFIGLSDTSYLYVGCQEIELSAVNDLYRWTISNM